MNRFAGRRGARTATSAALLVTALGLTGCGADGVMHNGNLGARSGDVSVSTSQVQKTTSEIQSLSNGQSNISAAGVIPFMVLAPKLEAVGRKYGIGVSNHDIEQLVNGAKLSPETLEAFRANVIASRSQDQQAPAGMAEAVKKVMSSKIDVNPRFGAIVDGQAANAYVDWERYQQDGDSTIVPNGRPTDSEG